MSQHLWLLVEWTEEAVFSSYGIVNANSLISDGSDVHVGKVVNIRNKHGNGIRKAQILRISDNKSYVKELKTLLERQDQQVKNVVSLCVNTIKEMKSVPGNLFLGERSSARQSVPSPVACRSSQRSNVRDDETSDSEQESNVRSFNGSTNKQNHQYNNIAESSLALYNNLSFHHSKNNPLLLTSTPLAEPVLGKKIKINENCDKSTQTDLTEKLPTLSAIEDVEVVVHRLYKQFTTLVSNLPLNDAVPMMSETSDWERTLPNQQSITSECPTLKEDWISQNMTTTIREADPSEAVGIRVRRASAHTTNIGEPVPNNTDMVPIGNGSVLVPHKLLEDLDWSSYTSVTRQLLQAVFPRRVLATHSLSGKQSPAFANKPPKKRLDPKLVDDIVDTVSLRCGVDKRLVRSCITTKCTDEAKLYRNRQHFKHLRQMNHNQENALMSSESSNAS
ncbi:hypothetical protein RR46_04860 [Papilio xuthus]|uniref:BEN domain-containing protein n=1 Tax=Papilio xuthus TaxID=66420 RepID=A0A194Q2W6_PAPXU|nr:hypothetical protein RR46_04860 [Papilio xuthus]